MSMTRAAKRRAPVREADLKLSILRTLAAAYPRLIIERRNSGSRSFRFRGSKAGTPDFEITLPYGRTLWLEVKRDAKEKLRPEQTQWHAKARALGHVVEVVWDLQTAVAAVAHALRMADVAGTVMQIGAQRFNGPLPPVQHVGGAMLPGGK
jgi:hypothetical protein